MIKLAKRAAALLLAGVLAVSLTACSPRELASGAILKAADLFGLRSDDGSGDDEATETIASVGGEIAFPDNLPDSASHLNQIVSGGALYVSFSGITNRNTEYFVAASDSIQITAYATADGTSRTYTHFKTAVWELSEDRSTTSYLSGTTVYFPLGESCGTCTITGLTAGNLYKVNISYDSGEFYITGGLKVEGVGSEQLVSAGDDT